MHTVIEYVLVGTILLLILPLSQMSIASTVRYEENTMAQNMKYPAVRAVLNLLLLSPGYPSNWGDLTEEPEQLGLAHETAVEAKVLDVSKVMRLSFGLSPDCNFDLAIEPVFTIGISNVSNNYGVTVTDNKGYRVGNVNITAYYIPNSYQSAQLYPSKTALTEVNGQCNLSFTWSANHTLVVVANQLEVKGLATLLSGVNVEVQNGCIFRTDYPAIQTIEYATGTPFGGSSEYAYSFAEIEGVTYFVRLLFWR